MRATTRGTQLVLHLTLGMILSSGYRVRYGRRWHLLPAGQAIIRWWMQRLTRIVGIRITQYGTPLTVNALFISNHISFLDIVVISAIVPVRFLSKHSVRYWPIIGYLTALSGSLFIERGKHRQLSRTLIAIQHALNNTRPVLIFPEGTTSLGTQVLTFHSGLFQAAIDKQLPVQTLTVHYRRDQRPDRIAAYINKDNFLINLLRLMAQPQTDAHLSFTSPVDSHNHTRRSLAAICHARISQNLAFLLQSPGEPRVRDDSTAFALIGECNRGN